MLAHSMLATIPDNSITLFDKLFYSEDLLLTLNQKGCNRHWLLPAWKNIASEMIELGNTASPGTIPKRLEHLRGALEVVFITKRPRPSRPRSVKISKTRYPVNIVPLLLTDRHYPSGAVFLFYPKQLSHKPTALSFIIFATMYNAYTQRYCTLQVTSQCRCISAL